MAKKLGKSLNRKSSGFIETGKFTVDNSKMYLAAALIMFHILPLMFALMGETGHIILLQVFLMVLNPLFIFCVDMFHAVRLGFSFKFPLIMGVIAAASLFMYYELGEGVLLTTAIFFCVYTIFAFASEAIGGFIKHLMGGY